MSSNGQQGATLPIRADGLNLARLAQASATQQTLGRQVEETHRFWASRARGIQSDHREIMEVSFGSNRLVNHLSFKVGRFPVVLEAQYLDENGDWQALTYAKTRGKKGPRREIRREATRLVVSESIPARVDSAKAASHPQHFGKGHWMEESWKVTPVRARKIRLVLTRNHRGQAPKNPRGEKVPYSVAIKGLTIGYRVSGGDDLPPTTTDDEWWASSKDILGSQTSYATYRQSAGASVDGNLDTYWRSEPQPFPFAVVNLMLDLRDATGVAPVVDRFWVDPVTIGVHCNVYYSDAEPDGLGLEGSREPIPALLRTEVGNPLLRRVPVTNEPLSILLGPADPTGVEIHHSALRMRFDQPWWVGIDGDALVAGDDAQSRPLLTLGTTQIRQEGGALKVEHQNGTSAEIDLDPNLHRTNTRYRLLVSYHPNEPGRPPYLRIAYASDGYSLRTAEAAVDALTDTPGPIKIGLPPGTNDVASAIALRGLVVKAEALTDEAEEWFLDEGETFVREASSPYEDRGTAQNALLRMHPTFVSDTNLFGVVGGNSERLGQIEWTPVLRDYVLKQGYMHVPPTRAKYWKFEMTGLMAEVYENFLPIERNVLVFPPDVVAAHQTQAGAQDNHSSPPGVDTIGNVAPSVAYRDALEAVRRPSPGGPHDTDVLLLTDPLRAEQAAQTGWVWTYRPWHVGSTAPKFLGTRQHRYENVLVKHTTKVAYFAAIREIRPFRIDYTFDDDTPEYAEHLLDFEFLDLTETDGVRFDGHGGVQATVSNAKVTSTGMLSYRTVRGVQFASQETDAVQVLTDPDFNASHLDWWKPYGDATLTWHGPRDVEVNRGWFGHTYGDLEQAYGSYGEMDGVLYALLEGNNQTSGSAEGGVTSESYTPSGAGKVQARVEVSAAEALTAPITVEIVSVYDGRVVASSEERWIQAGETALLTAAYAPGSLTEKRTYGDIETLVSTPTSYGELETYRYYELESETGLFTDLYVRVRQQGPTDESFRVHRIGLYDSPVAWFFSNDDGATWWQAIDVRNDPYAVLIFPPSDTPEVPGVGRTLRWKAEIYRQDAAISALHIRPWYGTRARTVDRNHGLEGIGPNRSTFDDFPATHQHPMWQERFNPIEHIYREPEQEVTPAFWRNLVTNPGGEGSVSSLVGTGGTVSPQCLWGHVPPQPNFLGHSSQSGGATHTLEIPVGAEPGDLFVIGAHFDNTIQCTDSRVQGTVGAGAGRVYWGILDESTAPFVVTGSGFLNWSATVLGVWKGVTVAGSTAVADLPPVTVPQMTAEAVIVVGMAGNGTVKGIDIYETSVPTRYNRLDAEEHDSSHIVNMFDWTATPGETQNPVATFAQDGTPATLGLVVLRLEGVAS